MSKSALDTAKWILTIDEWNRTGTRPPKKDLDALNNSVDYVALAKFALEAHERLSSLKGFEEYQEKLKEFSAHRAEKDKLALNPLWPEP